MLFRSEKMKSGGDSQRMNWCLRQRQHVGNKILCDTKCNKCEKMKSGGDSQRMNWCLRQRQHVGNKILCDTKCNKCEEMKSGGEWCFSDKESVT